MNDHGDDDRDDQVCRKFHPRAIQGLYMRMMMTMVATMTTATLTRTMKKICRSVGICLLELAEGRPPLSHLHPMRALMQVLLFLCGFRKRQKIIKCSTTMFHKNTKDYQRAQCSTTADTKGSPATALSAWGFQEVNLKMKILSNIKIRSPTVRDGVKFVRPKNPLRTFRTLTFKKRFNIGVEHFFEWPCRWVSHQGLWSKTFYAGTLYLVQLP